MNLLLVSLLSHPQIKNPQSKFLSVILPPRTIRPRNFTHKQKQNRTSMVVSRTIFIISTITSLFTIAAAQNCKDYKFPDNKLFSSCTDLPVLDAYLHWNYNPFETTAEIAYRARQTPQGWISWGINPAGGGMIGTQALIAHQDTQGKMRVFSSQVTSYSPSSTPGPLSFPVSELSAEYSTNEMIIFAVLGPLEGGNSFNITWQAGNLVLDDIP